MPWQLFLAGYLILGVTGYLLRRKLAHSLAFHNRLVNGFFFLITLYPTGLIVAFFLQPNLNIGWQNIIFIVLGCLIFPLANILAYKANDEVDAGLYTVLNNLKPLITISTAWLLLQEKLIGSQLIGAAIIISSSFLVTLPNLKHHIKNKNFGLLFALASIFLVAIGTTYERFMLTRIDFGAYLVFGWGAQASWMVLIAWPERRHIHLLKNPQNFWPVLTYGISSSFKGLFFLAAVKLSDNVSLVSASSSFMAVLTVLAAYVTLRERKYVWLKLVAAFAGAGGLLLLSTP